MSDLLAKVTPLTRGIIWLHSGRLEANSPTYQAVDYLLNGLLTASLRVKPEAQSHVMMTSNFHHPLHIYIVAKITASEYESYLKLLKKDITAESTVLVIDENDAYNDLLAKTPKDLRSLLHHWK